MPTYDYQCKACGYIFEKKLLMKDNLLPESEECPKCNKKEVKQYLGSMPEFVDPIRLGRKKPDSDFNDRLKQIKKNSPGSNFNIRD